MTWLINNDVACCVVHAVTGPRQCGKSTQLEVRIDEETVWLTQAQMVELFSSTKQNISLHIKNIFKEGELIPSSTVREYLTVQIEGARRVHRFYITIKHSIFQVECTDQIFKICLKVLTL